MTNYGVYATAEEIKLYLSNQKNANFLTRDDDQIRRFCVEASRTFDAECKRPFYPRKETRYYDHPGDASTPALAGTMVAAGGFYDRVNIYPNELLLDDDLLEIVTLTTDNGGTTISSSDYFLLSGKSYNRHPYDRIQLDTSGTQTTFDYSDTIQQANAVTGIWGYHQDWANAWAQVDTVQDDPLSSSATTVKVSDVDGADELGLTPRFQVQQLIRFGSDNSGEYAFITGLNPETGVNTLTVIRGVNGTTAAQQAQDTDIYVYRPMPEIVLALKVLSTYAYRRKDAIGTDTDRPLASSTGVMILPSKLPGEVSRMLQVYKKGPVRR